jgi:hypothetical protein
VLQILNARAFRQLAENMRRHLRRPDLLRRCISNQ